MQKLVIVTAIVLAAPALAQGDAGPAPSSCYIEVPKLMAAPPAGIDDLRAAIGALDEKLRPQVEEISRLKAELEALQQRQQQAMQSEDEVTDLAALGESQKRVSADLDAGQAQLKLDYAAQQAAIVGPVQSKISQRAQTFGTEKGCSQLKMARPPDLAALTAAGARDVTADFVSWYALNKT